MSLTTLGVAVIGAGPAGRAHAHGYRTASTLYGPGLPPVRLVSIADVAEPLARATAARYGYERADTSWQAVAEAPDIDVVSVVVANPLHREIVSGLLAAGKHVLCEKPLAPSTQDAQAMVDAAAEADTLARVGFTFRFTPGIRAIHNLIAAGELGTPLHFSGQYWADYGCDPQAPITWRYRGDPGTGALADLASHLSDTAEFLCGRAQVVNGAQLATFIKTRPVPIGATIGHQKTEVSRERADVENDDTVSYLAEYESGASGSVAASRVAHGHPNTLRFELLCERGSVSFDTRVPAEIGISDSTVPDVNNGYRRVLLGSRHPFVGGGMPFDGASIGFGHNDSFAFQARAFLDEIVGRDELPRCLPLSHGLHNLRLQEAVVASAANHTRVPVSG